MARSIVELPASPTAMRRLRRRRSVRTLSATNSRPRRAAYAAVVIIGEPGESNESGPTRNRAGHCRDSTTCIALGDATRCVQALARIQSGCAQRRQDSRLDVAGRIVCVQTFHERLPIDTTRPDDARASPPSSPGALPYGRCECDDTQDPAQSRGLMLHRTDAQDHGRRQQALDP